MAGSWKRSWLMLHHMLQFRIILCDLVMTTPTSIIIQCMYNIWCSGIEWPPSLYNNSHSMYNIFQQITVVVCHFSWGFFFPVPCYYPSCTICQSDGHHSPWTPRPLLVFRAPLCQSLMGWVCIRTWQHNYYLHLFVAMLFKIHLTKLQICWQYCAFAKAGYKIELWYWASGLGRLVGHWPLVLVHAMGAENESLRESTKWNWENKNVHRNRINKSF